MHQKYWYALLVLAVFTCACSPNLENVRQPGESQAAEVSSLANLSSTPSPTASATATYTATPTSTPTVTPTPTATPHPMSIAALRMGDYPGSEITFEETLEAGANYNRYYVSYLSEGLRQYGLLTIPYSTLGFGAPSARSRFRVATTAVNSAP